MSGLTNRELIELKGLHGRAMPFTDPHTYKGLSPEQQSEQARINCAFFEAAYKAVPGMITEIHSRRALSTAEKLCGKAEGKMAEKKSTTPARNPYSCKLLIQIDQLIYYLRGISTFWSDSGHLCAISEWGVTYEVNTHFPGRAFRFAVWLDLKRGQFLKRVFNK
jgi:hypothetical protein